MEESSNIVVLSDGSGAYYALPLADLQRYRVPAELEERAAALLAREDVTGYGIASSVLFFSMDLQSQDKLGNFQIQTLMSAYNEAQTLASSVQKRRDETNNSIIGKI